MKPNSFLPGPARHGWTVAVGWVALGLALSMSLRGSDAPGVSTNAPVTAAEQAAVEKPKSAHVLPASIEEVVRMAEAGVSAEVMVKFVEESGVAYRLGGADIVMMKQRGLPDEVTVRMIEVGRQRRHAAAAAARTEAIAAPAIVRTLATDGELDPESYEFFWMHHAYPRVLSGSYERLSPYYSVRPGYYPGYFGAPGYAGPFRREGVPYRTKGFPRDSFHGPPRRR